MHIKNDNLTSIDDIMDNLYGKVGTPEREAFRSEAYTHCVGEVIHEIRKAEKISQSELANRVGLKKSYISKIEKGIIEPSVSTFYRIANALGRSVELLPA
ncbi:MAG: helix-turn-helix domain-containing protein [Bacteroidales bacterium]|nr:helix-turn-helix domain-containing protein [Bacteroidales bacterium]